MMQSIVDQLITEVDHGLRSLFTVPVSSRVNPSEHIDEATLSASEQKKIVALMRINHTGEVCAQALYRGQMSVAQDGKTFDMLSRSCIEETDHLSWTHQRLQELSGRASYLNPVWYFTSYFIGLFTAKHSDAISLGFVEETEKQVGEHLAGHLQQLPVEDKKTAAILQQMQIDEACHGDHAHQAGATTLPLWLRAVMRVQSKVMTTLAYWI